MDRIGGIERQNIRITNITNPFDPMGSREVKEYPRGLSLAECIDLVRDPLSGCFYVAAVNGELVPEGADYALIHPQGNVVLCAVPEGGGGKGGGKNILRTVLSLVVVIVAAAATWYLGGEGGVLAGIALFSDGVTTYSLSTLGANTVAALVGGAINIAGSLLINALMPMDMSSASGAGSSSTYGWDASENPNREGVVWPVLYGTMRITPPIIGRYIEVVKDKQYLNILFAIADHPIDGVDDTSMMINGNLVTKSAHDINWEVLTGGLNQAPPQYFSDARTTKPSGAKLPVNDRYNIKVSYVIGERVTHMLYTYECIQANGPGNLHGPSDPAYWQLAENEWVTVDADGTQTEGLGIAISFPRGLFISTDTGGLAPYSVKLDIEYKRVGDEDWTRFQSYVESMTTVQDRWSAGYWYGDEWHEIGIGSSDPDDHVEGDFVYPGDFGYAPGIREDENDERLVYYWHWVEDAIVYQRTTVSRDYVTITGSQSNPLRRVFYADRIEPGEYQIRARYHESEVPHRLTNVSADAYLDYVESMIYDDFSYPGSSLLALRALATDKLSGGMPQVSFVATRSTVPVWTGAAYENLPADNPAWAAYDVLHNINYGGGVPAARLRYADFLAWANNCDLHYTSAGVASPVAFKCNLYVDAAASLRKVLNTIGVLGRGTVAQMGSDFTCFVDKLESLPVQTFIFNMGNIAKNSFALEYMPLDERANAVDVTYWDKDNRYKQTTLEVHSADFDTTTVEVKKTSLNLPGCTSRAEALAHARFALNNNRLLTATATFNSDVDAIGCLPWDPIEVQHDVTLWGNGGRILAVDGDTITIDKPITLEVGKTYTLRIQHAATDEIKEYTITCADLVLNGALHMTDAAPNWPTGDWSAELSFDSVNRKLYVVNTYTAFDGYNDDCGIQCIVKIDLDTWSVEQYWDATTTPAIPAKYFITGSDNLGSGHLMGSAVNDGPHIVYAYGYNWYYGTNNLFLFYLDCEGGVLRDYEFKTAAYPNRNVKGFTAAARARIICTFVDASDDKIWIAIHDDSGSANIRIGYLTISDAGTVNPATGVTEYTFTTLITHTFSSAYYATHLRDGHWSVGNDLGHCVGGMYVDLNTNQIVISGGVMGSYANDTYGSCTVFDIESAAVVKQWLFNAGSPEWLVVHRPTIVDGKVYAPVQRGGDGLAYRETHLGIFDPATGEYEVVTPSYIDGSFYLGWGAHKLTGMSAPKYLGDNILAVIHRPYGVGYFDIVNRNWQRVGNDNLTGFTSDGDNPSQYGQLAYDSVNNMVMLGDLKDKGVIAYISGTNYSIITVPGGFSPAPAAGDKWVLTETGMATKLFRLLKTTRRNEMTRRMVCLEYNPDVYDDSGDLDEPEPEPVPIYVDNLRAEEVQHWTGTPDTDALLSWTGTAILWQVFYKRSGDTQWAHHGSTRAPSYRIAGLDRDVEYTFAVSHTMNPDDGETVTLTLVGLIAIPDPPDPPTVAISGQFVNISWPAADNVMVTGYKVYLEAVCIAGPITATEFNYAGAVPVGNNNFYLSLVTAGGESDLSDAAVLAVQAPATPAPTASVSGTNAVVSWAPCQTIFPIHHYTVNGVDVGNVTSYSEAVSWTGEKVFTVVAVDACGNSSAAGTDSITINDLSGYALSFVTTGMTNSVRLDLTYDSFAEFAAVEIWASTTNDRAGAVKIGETAAETWTHSGISVVDQWFYWARLRDIYGNYSSWYPAGATSGVPGQASMDPNDALQILMGAVSKDQLSAAIVELLEHHFPEAIMELVLAADKARAENQANRKKIDALL